MFGILQADHVRYVLPVWGDPLFLSINIHEAAADQGPYVNTHVPVVDWQKVVEHVTRQAYSP